MTSIRICRVCYLGRPSNVAKEEDIDQMLQKESCENIRQRYQWLLWKGNLTKHSKVVAVTPHPSPTSSYDEKRCARSVITRWWSREHAAILPTVIAPGEVERLPQSCRNEKACKPHQWLLRKVIMTRHRDVVVSIVCANFASGYGGIWSRTITSGWW